WRSGWGIRAAAWLGAAMAAIAIAGVSFSVWRQRSGLDASRVVVFPLRESSAAAGPSGEEIATYIGYALEGTRPLRWFEGWELMTPAERTNAAALRPARARGGSPSGRAGFFIDGSILRWRESTTVVLQLHNVAGDTIVSRAGASGTGSVPEIGLRAVATLLPALLAPGRPVDLSALEQLNPT